MTPDLYTYAALVLAMFLSAALGGNNFSTCLGASLGAGIVRLSNAILIATAGVILGTLFEGHKLSNVVAGQILPTLSAPGLVVILVSSLLVMAAVTLLHVPLSLSQVMVGAAWGLALATGTQIGSMFSIEVTASWISSPILAFLISAAVEIAVLRLGRKAKDVFALNHLYAILTLIAGFYAAYTLGANTLGLVVGLFPQGLADPLILSLVFSAGAVVGIAFLSTGTVRSVADNLVGLSPSTALSAQFGGALSVHLFTQLGLPVSISQVVIGGMGGAASVKRIAITNKRIIQQIIAGWTIGPLAGAIVSFLLAKVI
ncbi:anion permease [Candidatus Bathyarchaeota archaeon]|nr:anion permease [Candidatus Bathyarchaeota archaeon]